MKKKTQFCTASQDKFIAIKEQKSGMAKEHTNSFEYLDKQV